MSTLTLKQHRFVKKYLENGGNGRLAAQAAGYKGNPHTLEQIAYENLRKPVIAQALAPAMEAAGITPEAVTEKLSKLVHTEPEGAFTYDHKLKAISLAMRANGMIRPDKQPTNIINTMQLIQLRERAEAAVASGIEADDSFVVKPVRGEQLMGIE